MSKEYNGSRCETCGKTSAIIHKTTYGGYCSPKCVDKDPRNAYLKRKES